MREPALMTDVVLTQLFSMVCVADLKACRLVCKKWNMSSKLWLSRKSVVRFGKHVRYKGDCLRHGTHSSSYTDIEPEHYAMESLKVEAFIKFFKERVEDIGIAYSNIDMHPSLISEFAGDLLLMPGMRDSITSLNIVVYPMQLDWLKCCLQELTRLKELRIQVTLCDRIFNDNLIPPPLDFPKKYLTVYNEVPPSLRIPEDILQQFQQHAEEHALKDLSLETLIFCQNRSYSILLADANLSDKTHFLRHCVSGLPPISLRWWILQRAPNLKDLECCYSGVKSEGLVETLRRLSTEYKGKGFRSLKIQSFENHNTGFDEHITPEDATNALLVFLKSHCSGTLEKFMLNPGSEQIDWRNIFLSPDFPVTKLKSFRIKDHRFLRDSHFNWNLVDGSPMVSTTEHHPHMQIGSGTAKELDFLDVFPLDQKFEQLLELKMNICLQINSSLPHLGDNVQNSPAIVLEIPTTRIFPRVHTLKISVSTLDHLCRDEMFRFDYMRHIAGCFPSLNKLQIHCDGPDYYQCVKESLQTLPSNLESLKLTGNCNSIVTDEDFLENEALLRFKNLREFSFSLLNYKLTDKVVYNGFLKLCKLKVLTFPFSQRGRLEFSSDAIFNLGQAMGIFKYATHNMINEKLMPLVRINSSQD